MFKGEESIRLPGTLPEDQLHEKIEDALRGLGRVRVDKRGGLLITPKDGLGSFLTDVTMDGEVRARKDGYEVVIGYDCKPSVVNWAISAVLFFFTCFGGAFFLISMASKGPVGEAVRRGLDELADAVEGDRRLP